MTLTVEEATLLLHCLAAHSLGDPIEASLRDKLTAELEAATARAARPEWICPQCGGAMHRHPYLEWLCRRCLNA